MPRARDLGLAPGDGDTGEHNAITDVPGIRVGHTTIRRPPDVHTGVTAIDAGATPLRPLPAGFFSGNGYGKFIGSTQVAELGVVESPIVLTSTLSAFRAADALVDWMLARPDCAGVRSFNPVVGECNDGYLSDIRARPVQREDVLSAIATAATGPVPEGCVGAGTGMAALGFKAGIGTSSRLVDLGGTRVSVGALVLANFGGRLRIGGRVIDAPRAEADGSCVVVIGCDARLDARQLNRLARRGVYALGRVGASYSNGSGDYGLALSTSIEGETVDDARLSPLFESTLDCVEEAVLNSLFTATSTVGVDGHVAQAVTLD
ncbi:P1 family peptidase [Stackebrandtia nassauensis]|uniref:Peptidase S58 DmpA n=1 Tax=Stackebrandtia nassauensis (strain DSM 44728 / CIP 108903 / NRRL B-16338 / NBRC 102104 / LLR-40K-21) TaxID=446470 RepID=D3PVD0_STANL|nr:P1 family peptidase [Stackebrandtia nassauensis]ADD41183.1 peptidase S58 DmpA [Stackebrandtia nassauensis DSM 44728]